MSNTNDTISALIENALNGESIEASGTFSVTLCFDSFNKQKEITIREMVEKRWEQLEKEIATVDTTSEDAARQEYKILKAKSENRNQAVLTALKNAGLDGLNVALTENEYDKEASDVLNKINSGFYRKESLERKAEIVLEALCEFDGANIRRIAESFDTSNKDLLSYILGKIAGNQKSRNYYWYGMRCSPGGFTENETMQCNIAYLSKQVALLSGKFNFFMKQYGPSSYSHVTKNTNAYDVIALAFYFYVEKVKGIEVKTKSLVRINSLRRAKHFISALEHYAHFN